MALLRGDNLWPWLQDIVERLADYKTSFESSRPACDENWEKPNSNAATIAGRFSRSPTDS